MRLTGANRSINRQKLPLDEVRGEIQTPGSWRHRVFHGYLEMLQARSASRAFHPAGGLEVLSAQGPVFAVIRSAPAGGSGYGRDHEKDDGDDAQRVLCAVNCGGRPASLTISRAVLGDGAAESRIDLITGRPVPVTGDRNKAVIPLEPFAVRWITAAS